MADNIAITAGAGTAIKTDQGSSTSAHMQVMKLAYSADGDETLVLADADGLEVQIGKSVDLTVQPKAATAFPVTDNGGVLSVDDGAGSLTVDAPAATPVAVRLSTGAAFIDTIPVSDAGSTLSIDDNSSSITVDGTVAVTQSTPASSTNGWPVKVTDGTDTVGLYDPATVGRAAAYLAAERAQRPWDSRRICVARETRKLRRELATLAWEYARAALRVELMRVGCDCPLKEIPRQRLELVREVVKAAVRRMP